MGKTLIRGSSVKERLGRMDVDFIDVTLTTDIETHANGDVITLPIEIENAVSVKGGRGIIQSLILTNGDNSLESPAIELMFASETMDVSTTPDEGEAVGIEDADLTKLCGSTTVSNWSLVNTSKAEIATKSNIGLVVKAASTSTSIFVIAICRDASGFRASATTDLKLRLGIIKD